MKNCSVLRIPIIVLTPFLLVAQIENWVFTYNGTENSHDFARAIIYGTDGNIYAAGRSVDLYSWVRFTVVSLTAAGDTNWIYTNGWGCLSITYGSDGRIYAVGMYEYTTYVYEFEVVSLTNTGGANWVYRYNSPTGFDDGAMTVVYGNDGNIYAGGYSIQTNTNLECVLLVISLTQDGDTNWVYTYDGPGEDWGCARSIVYGEDENIYVAGDGTGASMGKDFIVVSLTTDGDTNWVYAYNGAANCDDGARSIVYGGDGNIYAAGYSNRDNYWSDGDFIIISLTTAGDTNWVYNYDGYDHIADGVLSLVYGADGNIYAAGYTNRSGGSDGDFMVISLTATGDTNWIRTYNGPTNGADKANSIVYGADSNIYVAGNTNGVIYDESDFLVMSFTTDGSVNWIYTYSGAGNAEDEATSIVYGVDGNLYVAGYSVGIGTGSDFTVISLSPGTGMEEGDHITCSNHEFRATIFSGPLQLPEGKTCKVFDITGRVVEPANITRGIYFIEIDGVLTQKVVKVR